MPTSAMETQTGSALFVGAGHGIGLGLVCTYLRRNPQKIAWATYRDAEKAGGLKLAVEKFGGRLKMVQCNPTEDDELAACFQDIKAEHRYLELIVTSVGMLHNERVRPEKSLRRIQKQALEETFLVNTISVALLAKHAKSFFPKAVPSSFVALSAMVGSISDNAVGGWYGYRASKAALNMFLKTMSIELKREGYPTRIFAIHPGTTKTGLSENFLAGVKHRIWTPDEAAVNILDVITNTEAESGSFLNWNGQTIPW